MFDAVLFDLDGTLLDSLELTVVSFRRALVSCGLPARGRADILLGMGGGLEEQFRRWGHGERVDELIDAYLRYNLAVHDDYARAYPGIIELVTSLRDADVPLGLVTSKRQAGARKGVRRLGLEGCFAVEIYGDTVARRKPDPEPVLRALAGLGRAPGPGVTFVGDARHDVDAGRAAGVHTTAVSWGAGKVEHLRDADVLVDDSAALRELLLPSS